MNVDADLLAILACPRCKGRLLPTAGGEGLGCPKCRVAYPVRDGIPVMIFEEADPWTPAGEDGSKP